jgi:uncharacterized protein YcaQ
VVRTPRLLSPFDPVVLHRDRAARLFAFDYQLECYLPAPQRRHGYFVLPLLHGARFLGRADCRADRSRDLLEIRRLALEDGPLPDDLPELLLRAAADLARANGCTQVSWHEVVGPDGREARSLRRTLRTDAVP